MKAVSFYLHSIFGTTPKRQSPSVPRRDHAQREPVEQKLADLSARATSKGTR